MAAGVHEGLCESSPQGEETGALFVPGRGAWMAGWGIMRGMELPDDGVG